MSTQNIITIASGKGGVGKTWFAITLAHAFAQRGENILLIDGDLGLANVDVQLGLAPSHDLGSVIAGQVALEDALTRVETSNKNAGSFDVLAGKSGSGVLSALSHAEVAHLHQGIQSLAGQYDRVIVDLAAGVDANVLQLCGHNGTTLTLVNGEPTSLTDAYALIKLVHMNHPHADVRVVANMAEDKADGQRIFGALNKACTTFLDINLTSAGIIPRDDTIRDTIRHQTALLYRHPGSKAAQAVLKIAENLIVSAKKTTAPPTSRKSA